MRDPKKDLEMALEIVEFDVVTMTVVRQGDSPVGFRASYREVSVASYPLGTPTRGAPRSGLGNPGDARSVTGHHQP